MRRVIMSTLVFLVAIAMPVPLLARADVGISREVRTGAQAGFDTAVYDTEGNIVPGQYLSVAVGIDISSYVENGDLVVASERTLYATVQRYEVSEGGDVTWGPFWDGWTHDATITLDPSFRSASGSGTLVMQECDYFAEPPTCIERGTLTISIVFAGTARLAPQPQHYTIPASFGALYAQHGAVITRSLAATGELQGEDLGTSVWGDFYRAHEGETQVWLPAH